MDYSREMQRLMHRSVHTEHLPPTALSAQQRRLVMQATMKSFNQNRSMQQIIKEAAYRKILYEANHDYRGWSEPNSQLMIRTIIVMAVTIFYRYLFSR